VDQAAPSTPDRWSLRPNSVGGGTTSLEDRGCEIGVLADQAMPLIPGS
jgi:hypothetical protein